MKKQEQQEQETKEAKSPKSTKEVIRQRVEAILRIILDGAAFWDVVQYATENGWGVGERQLRNYVAKAHRLIDKATERSRKTLLRMALARINNLYARSVAAGDCRTALACVNQECQLLGLYPSPEKELHREIEKLRHQLEQLEAGQAGVQPS